MANKESPADKIKREKAEEAAAKKADAKEHAAETDGVLGNTGDSAERLSDEDSAALEKSVDEVTTEEGDAVEATGGPVADVVADTPEAEKSRVLTEEELEDLIGDLEPGDDGYLPLNPDGSIAGPAKKGKPGPNELGAAVHAVQQRIPATLTTPAGAPITNRMNPSYVNPVKPRYG